MSEAFAWPLCTSGAVLLLGLAIVVRHRDAIDRFIDRTKHVGRSGVTASDGSALATQEDVKDTAKPSAGDELLKSFDNQLLLEQENLIAGFLTERNIADPRERERVLTRYLASAQLANRFEAIYGGIFGTQLQALHILNQAVPNGMLPAALEGWYKIGVAANPHIYGTNGERYAFGNWLSYLYKWSLITMVETEAHITLFGQEFLKYLIQNSYSLDKVG